jgi:proteasome lid subunit RPN8/RPN11
MLILPETLRTELLGAAAAADEVCGLLEGRRAAGAIAVTAFHPAANIAAHPADSFAIDPAVQFALQRRLRGSATGVIGCFHSHPNGRAEPSVRDRANGSPDGWVWLIAAAGGLAAFEAPSFRALTIRSR